MAREVLGQVLLAVFCLCAAGYVWAVYVYLPLDESQQRSRLSMVNLEQQERQLRAFQDALQDMGKQEGQLISDLRSRLAPYSEKDVPDLAKQLLQDLDHCALNLASCTPAVAVRKKLYLRQIIDLRLNGTFAHILSFIDLLATRAFLMHFKKGSFSKTGQALDFSASAAFYTVEADE